MPRRGGNRQASPPCEYDPSVPIAGRSPLTVARRSQLWDDRHAHRSPRQAESRHRANGGLAPATCRPDPHRRSAHLCNMVSCPRGSPRCLSTVEFEAIAAGRIVVWRSRGHVEKHHTEVSIGNGVRLLHPSRQPKIAQVSPNGGRQSSVVVSYQSTRMSGFQQSIHTMPTLACSPQYHR
jgi:hypothetical protein